MTIVVCPNCSTRVARMSNGSCPSCREPIPEATPTVEPAINSFRWPEERSLDDAYEPLFDTRLIDQNNPDVLRSIHLERLQLSRRFRRDGVLLVIAGLLLLAYGGMVIPVLPFLGALYLLERGSRFFTFGSRLRSPDAHLVMHDDPRPPILYLRPFSKDGSLGSINPLIALLHFLPWIKHLYRRQRIEEALTRYLWRIGPVVAIGRPRERLPELGAVRMYVSDANWQSEVISLMAKCRIVLFRIGSTEGLRWELETAINQVSPEKILFFLDNPGILAEWVQAMLPCELPHPLPSKARILNFDLGWIPNFYSSVKFFIKQTYLQDSKSNLLSTRNKEGPQTA